jgi:hypothetical protein
MSTTPLEVSVIDAQHFQVAIPGDAVKYKSSLLLRASEIEKVSNPEELEQAREVVAEIKKAVNDVEKARVELTAPFLSVQRQLKAKANIWRAELDTQIRGLEFAISDYIRKEQEKAAAIQRAAEAEERRKREESARAERIEQERLAELQRQQQEAERRAQELKSKAAREKAAAEALRLRREQEALELERQEREPEPIRAPVIALDVRALDTRGMQVRPTFEITVTDVHALYRAHPDLVSLEPKKALLNSLVADSNGEIQIPGVEIRKVLKTNVRSAL